MTIPSGRRTELLDVRTGRRVALDDFGTRAWALLADEPTFPALVERLRDAGVPAVRHAGAVVRLVAWWQDAGLVTWR